jgi:CRISPR/Cas system-associated exonuclease Cas4 (RecB family)
MKILIVSQARSGSSFLAKKIQEYTGYDLLWEPFNVGTSGLSFNEEVDFIKTRDNIIVKIVDNHFFKIEEFKNPNRLFDNFDKIVGLTRKNHFRCGISRYAAGLSNYWKDGNTKNFKSKKELVVDKKALLESIEFSNKMKNSILSFSIFQTTYEEITGSDGVTRVLDFIKN